jgi:integrase
MANTATLLRYAKTPTGWRRGLIVTSRNGRVKPDSMLVQGVEVPIPPTSQYQIRFYENGKAKYQSMGTDYEAAKTMMGKYTASRNIEAANVTLGITKPEKGEDATKTMEDYLREYLESKRSPSLDLSHTSIRHYEDTLPEFVRVVGKQFAKDVTTADVVRYMDTLKTAGYSTKTRTMKYTTVRGFLTYCGVILSKVIDTATHRRLAVKVEGNTDPYSQAELDKLLAVCDDYHRVVFSFLLATGMRYREASHTTWADINWERNVICVQGTSSVVRKVRDYETGKMVEKTITRRTKSRKSREVPLFGSLRPMLEAWRAAHPDTIYVFGTRRDLPSNHWLEDGKKLWEKAGLNCGRCHGCNGSGKQGTGCDKFKLHTFRHTYAHRLLDAGIGIHKVSKWLGHHSISVTQIYLSGGSYAADRDPFAAAA